MRRDLVLLSHHNVQTMDIGKFLPAKRIRHLHFYRYLMMVIGRQMRSNDPAFESVEKQFLLFEEHCEYRVALCA